jgi:tryptophan 2,3-dioxygenase
MSEKEKKTGKVDLTGEAVHWNVEKEGSYGTYLRLERILGAQTLRTDHHDEMLFILIHQVMELWMKLILHEVGSAIECVRNDRLKSSFKMLSRVSRVQSQMRDSWEVLSTLTPVDYVRFRDSLGHASGFQSHQYRILEFILGNKNAEAIEVHKKNPEIHAVVEKALRAPSLYDEALRLLARRGFDLPKEKLDRDWSLPYKPDPVVEAAWLKVYRDVAKYWDLYELAEKLVDVEDNFHQWRFRHMKTVERIIGFKRGTGGTGGVSYLVKALDLRFFPELWSVRTSI